MNRQLKLKDLNGEICHFFISESTYEVTDNEMSNIVKIPSRSITRVTWKTKVNIREMIIMSVLFLCFLFGIICSVTVMFGSGPVPAIPACLLFSIATVLPSYLLADLIKTSYTDIVIEYAKAKQHVCVVHRIRLFAQLIKLIKLRSKIAEAEGKNERNIYFIRRY